MVFVKNSIFASLWQKDKEGLFLKNHTLYGNRERRKKFASSSPFPLLQAWVGKGLAIWKFCPGWVGVGSLQWFFWGPLGGFQRFGHQGEKQGNFFPIGCILFTCGEANRT